MVVVVEMISNENYKFFQRAPETKGIFQHPQSSVQTIQLSKDPLGQWKWDIRESRTDQDTIVIHIGKEGVQV